MIIEYLRLEIGHFVDEVGWVIAQPLISLVSTLARLGGARFAVYYSDGRRIPLRRKPVLV